MKVLKFFSLILALLLILYPSASVSALSPEKNKFFGQNNIIFYNPDDTGEDSSCDQSTSCSTPSGSEITWIGDSYSEGAISLIRSTFSGVDVGPGTPGTSQSFVQSCKFVSQENGCNTTNPSGLTILRDIVNGSYGSDHSLRKYLVFALGTNGGISSPEIETILNLVGSDTKVVFVTPYIPNGSSAHERAKSAISAAASSNSNVIVADWAAVARDEYYEADPELIHPTSNGGYQAWVDTIKASFCANSASADCPSDGSTDGSSTDDSVGDINLPASSNARKIVETAVKMSWPTSDGKCRNLSEVLIPWRTRSSGGTQDCSNTLNDYARTVQSNFGGISLRDCGKFVGAAIRASGVDTSFRSAGVSSQMSYMRSSSKWTKVSTDGTAFPKSSLQPGDVLAYSSGNGQATGGHIMIWIGNQTVSCAAGSGGQCNVNIASASYQQWTPSLNYLSRMFTTTDDQQYYYEVYRYTGN